MAEWRKCESCKKVKPVEEFEGDAGVCVACATRPTRRPRPAPVTQPAPRATVARRVAHDPRGTGDVEVRVRRARRRALDRLAELHPEEFEDLLRAERLAEGLR